MGTAAVVVDAEAIVDAVLDQELDAELARLASVGASSLRRVADSVADQTLTAEERVYIAALVLAAESVVDLLSCDTHGQAK